MKKNLDQKSINLIRELGRQFSDTTIIMHEAIAKSVGLSGTDHKYLGILTQKGAMTAGELAKLTGLTTGAVTGVIDRLESKNLVKREFDKEDRRKTLIIPDYENTNKLLGDTFSDLQNKMVDFFSTLSQSEVEIIEKYLRSTMKIMNDITDNLKNEDKNI